MDKEQYYKILGLPSGASLQQIKEAYRDLVKVWHPDRFTSDPRLRAKAQEKLREINEAYERLRSNPLDICSSQSHTNSSKEEPTGKSAHQNAHKRNPSSRPPDVRPDFGSNSSSSRQAPIRLAEVSANSRTPFVIVFIISVLSLILLIWFSNLFRTRSTPPVSAPFVSSNNNVGKIGSTAETNKVDKGAVLISRDLEIRKVDFLNFTYPLSPEYEDRGFGKTAKVHHGKFFLSQTADSDAEPDFLIEKVLYADLTGDGSDEAIVLGIYLLGNYRDREIFIYRMDSGQPVLMKKITSTDVDNDYNRYFHPSDDAADLWPESDVKIFHNLIIIERAAFGSHATPHYTAVLKYAWNGFQFVLTGKPILRKNKQK